MPAHVLRDGASGERRTGPAAKNEQTAVQSSICRCWATWADVDRQTVGGEGGIRTHDTLASMPHFECGAFNHSTTSPTPALNDAGRSDHTSAMAADAVEQRPLNQAERTGPAVSRPAPKPASHRRWRVEAQADRGMGDKLDFALQVKRSGLSRCRQPCPRSMEFVAGAVHIDFAGGLDNSAARDQRGAALSARRTRKLKGNQLCMLSSRQAASSTVWPRTSF
jgi:hypothetical protein